MSTFRMIVFTFMLLAIGYVVLRHPGIIAVVAVIFGVLYVWEQRRPQRLLIERHSDSICTFARSFNCRQMDTWIVRAVFEEVGQRVGFPVRPEDQLENDLHMDFEDIDDIAQVVAQRTGRPLEHTESNPWYGRVNTVRDMVAFFTNQPRLSGPVG